MSTDLRALLGPIFSGAIGEVTDVLADKTTLAEQRTHALSQAVRDLGCIDPESLVENGFVTLLEGNTGYRTLHEMLKSPHFKPPGPFRVGLATTPVLTEIPGAENLEDTRVYVMKDVPLAVQVGVRGIRGMWRGFETVEVDRDVDQAVSTYARRCAAYDDGAKPSPNLLLDIEGELSSAIFQFSNQVDWGKLASIITANGDGSKLLGLATYGYNSVHNTLAAPVLKLLAGALVLAHGDYEVVPGNPEDYRKYNYPSSMLTLTFTAKAERAVRLKREYQLQAFLLLVELIRSEPNAKRLEALKRVEAMIGEESHYAAMNQALIELSKVAPRRVLNQSLGTYLDYLLIPKTYSRTDDKGRKNTYPNNLRTQQALLDIFHATGGFEEIMSARLDTYYDESHNSGTGWCFKW